MNKICSKCKQEKPIECFSLKNKQTGVRNSWCKDCRNKYDREKYKTDNNKKSQIKNRRKLNRLRNKEYINNYKASHGCAICGDKRFYVLDFHHQDDNKEHCISLMLDYSLDSIKKEIDKCTILCANCHREEHYKNSL